LRRPPGAAGARRPGGRLAPLRRRLARGAGGGGGGGSRVARIEVTEARAGEEAERVARAIANSPLVQTALYGRDSNWGRIAQAAGMALAGSKLGELGPDRIRADELAGEGREPEIGIRLGRGAASTPVYFSDLTPDYIPLNGEYTT